MGPCYGKVGDLIRRGRDTRVLSPTPLLLWENTERRQPFASREESSSGIESADTLISDFPVFRTVRNKRLSLKPTSLWYFVMAARAD